MFSADPKKFMISTLERLQKSKSTKRDYPCLFDDSNIQSVYGMLDPTNRGYITLKQYCEGNMCLLLKTPINRSGGSVVRAFAP